MSSYNKKVELTRAPIQLDPEAQRIFDAAVKIARLRNQEYIATDHLLLAIFDADPNQALQKLEHLGISPEQISRSALLLYGKGELSGPLPLTPHAEAAFITARRIALERGCGAATAVDMLLALAHELEGEASALLLNALRSDQ